MFFISFDISLLRKIVYLLIVFHNMHHSTLLRNTHFFPSQLKNSPTFAWILRGWTSTAGENVEINAGMWGENRSFNEHF